MPDKWTVPKRAVPLTVVGSADINENWVLIQQAINDNAELAQSAYDRIDLEKGAPMGIAGLDVDGVVVEDQLPPGVFGHVFEADSLYTQLGTPSYIGSICFRTDIRRTYVLQSENYSVFSNWIEISAADSGGEVGGNPPYTNSITNNVGEDSSLTWVYDAEQEIYTRTYEAQEHNQGATRFLFVMIKSTNDQNISTQYSVDDNGLVTLTTNTPFSGDIMISNLQGNCSSLNMVPYAVNFGARNESGEPDLLQYGTQYITLNTNERVVLVDGLGIQRQIQTCANNTDTSSFSDGIYIVFIDSELIENTQLSLLTILSADSYLGVVDDIPKTGQEGDRCFVAFDKSYEYRTNGWRVKAFCPVGKFEIQNNQITKVITFNYSDNNYDVTKNSNVLDILYGSEIKGLNYTGTSNTLSISSGKCLCGNKIIELSTNIEKDITQEWQEGNNQGGLISIDNPNQPYTVWEVSNDTYPSAFVLQEGEPDSVLSPSITVYTDTQLTDTISNQGTFIYTGSSQVVIQQEVGIVWMNIFLIHNDLNIDILCSRSLEPTLPTGYKHYRRLCTVPMQNNELVPMHQYGNKFYYDEWVEQTTQIQDHSVTITVNVPDICDEILTNIQIEQPQKIQVKAYNGSMVSIQNNNIIECCVPNVENKYEIIGEQVDTPATIYTVGYIDERKL